MLGSAAFVLFHDTVSRAADPGAARVQLQQGYTFKQAGKCAEAIPYFVESIRLDRQPKALIHLADCERDTGKYVSAEEHLVAARDLGRELSLTGLSKLAEERLAELEPHLPRLTLRLPADSTAKAVVTRDGVVLAPLSLGVALPVDPGSHEIRVREGGLERRYSLKMRDGESKELEVTALGGDAVATATPPPPQSPTAIDRPAARSPKVLVEAAPPLSSTTRSTRRNVGIAVAGVGLVGLGLGSYFGLKARAKSQSADRMCTAAEPCASDGVTHYHDTVQDAKSARTAAIASFATGGALLVSGGVLFFTALPAHNDGLRITPIFAGSSLGAVAEGTW
jgi:hypothetical protein